MRHPHKPAGRSKRFAGVFLAAAVAVSGLALAGCQANPGGDQVVVAAGDISQPALGDQRRTSDLVLGINPALVLALGDLQYTTGSLADFQRYYGPTWGRLKAKTRPVPGNHEYLTAGAAGYFSYFGAAAAKPHGTSYYSYDTGGWHMVALDSEIARSAGSAQEQWLKRDLAATSKRCVLAYWHRPLFSSGITHGGDPSVRAFWNDLYGARADIVLNGHEHLYERFARQNPSGAATTDGIREYVVGTGGGELYNVSVPLKPNSEAVRTRTFGVLKLTLHPTSYSWQFINTSNQVLDSGGPVNCH